MKLTPQELLDYAAGRSDPETAQRILDELENPDSEANRFVNEMVSLTEKGLKADWGGLLSVGAIGPQEGADESRAEKAIAGPDFPAIAKSPGNTDTKSDAVQVTRRHKIARRTLVKWLSVGSAATILAAIGLFWAVNHDHSGRLVAKIDDPFGQVVKTDRGEVLGLEAFPEEWREPIGEMLRSGAVQVPEERTGTRGGNRGKSSSMYLCPVGTVVKSNRPALEWRSRGENVTYRVLVYRSGQSEPLMKSQDLRQLRWEPDKALNRGVDYAWEVDVVQDGKTYVSDEDRPRFKVLDDVSLGRIEEEERAARGSHLVLALVYLRAGLLDDAKRELESLKQGQGGSLLVDELLESLAKQR